jgi:hypothetical protein
VPEIEEPGSQVQDEDDTIIQVDWEFSTGTKKGEKARGRWMYFQDGVALTLGKESPAVVLGRYSSTGDVAAFLSPFGRGWVGCVGPHPEADQSWCMFVVSRFLESVRSLMISQTTTKRSRTLKGFISILAMTS